MYNEEIAMTVITYQVSYKDDIISFALCHQISTLLKIDTRNRPLYIVNMELLLNKIIRL